MDNDSPFVLTRETDGHFQGLFAFRLLDSRPVPEAKDETLLTRNTDFINALYCLEPGRALALRYLVRPVAGVLDAGQVEVTLLGRVDGRDPAEAERLARRFADELRSLLIGIAPELRWEAVAECESLDESLRPIDWEKADLAEIRRREDTLDVRTGRLQPSFLARSAPDSAGAVYLPQGWLPHKETLPSLLRTLLTWPDATLWQVQLMPARLEQSEEELLDRQIKECERYLSGEAYRANLGEPPPRHRHRGSLMLETLGDQWLRLRDAPFQVRATLASSRPLPSSLLEAAGISITAPAMGKLSGGYDAVLPVSIQEKAVARSNAEWLEFAPWGETLAPPGLERLRCLMDALEASGAFRLPMSASAEGLPGIQAALSQSRPLPREVASITRAGEGLDFQIGVNLHRGMPQPIRMLEEDRRQHLYVAGQTGTGKTTLLKSMILADMKAGHGLAVVDPHGDLAEDLLALIPPGREADVILLDPTDTEFPIGLNLLECSGCEQRHFMVREMRAIMERLIDDLYPGKSAEYAGPAFYQQMQMNLLLVSSNLEDPGTLLEFHQIFRQEDYWRRWVPLRCQDPLLENWVTHQLPGYEYGARAQGEISMGEYVSSKFDDFVNDPLLRRLFGQKRSSIDLGKVMNEGRILIVNLAKGHLSEANSRFLGMVLMAKLQAAAMERVRIPKEQRRIFYLYVDEFQSFATENFSLMLSEARKFGLGLVLANQFLTQIRNPRIIQSIFGNVGTTISFRVGRDDAEQLARLFDPYFSVRDLTNLPNWTACVKGNVGGQVVTPYSLSTVPPPAGDSGMRERVREKSRHRYGRPQAEVDREIAESLAMPWKGVSSIRAIWNNND